MELQVQSYELPSAITFNYEELKTALTEKCHTYETMVYTDDQIKIAKSDRSNLRKLQKALNEERIRREREYMAPFSDFKDKINEIISIIDKPASIIDARVKEFESQKKEEKREQIKAVFEELQFPEYITLEKIWDDTWLNSTCALSRVKEDLKTIQYRNQKNVAMLQTLPEYAFEALEYYRDCLNVTLAMEKANDLARLARAKKAVAAEKPTEEIPFDGMPEPIEDAEVVPTEDEERFWVTFKACMSVSEARELRNFFEFNKIRFNAVRE